LNVKYIRGEEGRYPEVAVSTKIYQTRMKMKDIDGTRNPYIILNVIDSSLYKQLFI
jgi:hypothetical protein